jgi:hypothetical protein
MIAIGSTIVSDNLKKIKFVCDLAACHGDCCVEGDAGAPLEHEECLLIEQHINDIKPFMTEAWVSAVEQEGCYVEMMPDTYLTPLVDNRECVYVYFEDGITRCAIEKAFQEGKIPFAKPISCHLYPVRLNRYKDFEAVNYHEWHICEAALKNGKVLDVPLYIFLKDALIRKYGESWYRELVASME